MAAPSVSFDGTRLHTANAAGNSTDPTAANWTDLGGGKAATEPDFIYQGTGAVSEKVGTSEGGVAADFTATTDYTVGADRVWIAKIIATNFGVLNNKGSTGGILEIGSGGLRTNYDRYYVVGGDTYPIRGGWLIIPIDPNGGNQSARPGTAPTLTAIDYYGFACTFSASSKAENVAVDAVDYITNGTGLTLIGGDGASADGTFDDFVTADEGTSGNRWGIVTTLEGVLYVTGVLTIGTATETDFTDSNVVVVFPEAEFLNAVGFFGVDFGLQNASSVISVTNCVFQSQGTVGGSVDTRPDFTVTGTSGALTLSGCTFNVFREMTFTSGATVTGCIFIDGLKVTQAGATLSDCSFSGATTADGVAHLVSDEPHLISNCDFAFSDGHAIEVTTASPASGDSFVGNTFTGYGGAGTNDAAIYNTITPTTVDSYSETNQDSEYTLHGSATYDAVGQEFSASAGILNACRFDLRKVGSPTGNAFAKLYATDAGSPAAPTGAALATSEALDVSTLTGTLAITQLNFGDGYTLSAATSYFITIEYTGGDGSNNIRVGYDGSSPTHASHNLARRAVSGGAWSGVSTEDACFYVYRDGGLVLNISGGGSTPTFRTANAGASSIAYNTKTLKVTVKDQAGAAVNLAQCAIYRTDNDVELMNKDTDGTGVATADFAYQADTPVYFRVRKSSTGTRYIPVSGTGTITTNGLDVTVTLREDAIAA